MPRSNDKRERLLAAARVLIHRQGFGQTTLAHIAGESGVPLGNVYYYFKTKDELAQAVIGFYLDRFRQMVHALEERKPDPKQRLKAYLASHSGMRGEIAEYGCPVGSLCQELNKERTPLAESADEIIKAQVQWVTEQFRLMGRRDAGDLGLELIARLQGFSLLASSLKDPDLMAGQTRRLQRWLDAV